MNIFGYGGTPQDRWGNENPNKWQLEGKTLEEYIQAEREAGNENAEYAIRTQFWKQRDAAVEAARKELESMTPSSSKPIYLTNTTTQDASAVIQVQRAADQWEKLDRITKGEPINDKGAIGGTVLGYDLETFGDTSNGARGQFGITEFGIGTTVFKEGGLFDQKGHSLAIGLSDEQAQYVTSVLSKYKAEGWNSLSTSEQVTMQRMSMYAGNGTNYRNVFRQITEEGDFKGLWEVKPDGLIAPDMSIQRIQAGIDNLQAVYRQGAVDSVVILKAMGYMKTMYGKGTASKGAVLTAANSQFDISTLARYTDGQYDDLLDAMSKKTVDLVYGVRAAAALNTISVSEYQKIMHGARGGGASVQSLLLSLKLNEVESHLAISDINQQIQLLAARNFAKNKTLGQDLSQFFRTVRNDNKTKIILANRKGKGVVKKYNAENTLFLLNRGWLDKRKGRDIALIDTGDGVQATQNYTISGEYWELDSAHTGEVEDGYRLSMVSTADGTIISKRFENEKQAVEFLRSNADWYERREVINTTGTHRDINIERQAEYKYQDRGRRAFEKAIDPASVAVDIDKGKPENGFATMERFLEWNETYGNQYSATPQGFRQFVADMSKSKDGFNIDTANTMQEFIGAQAKVSDEKKLLKTIVDEVNSVYGETTISNNMQKTIAFRRAYDSAMEEMTSKGRIQHSRKYYNLIMNDIYGVDVRMPDGRINRINTHTASTATRDVNRIFGQLTKDESVEIVNNLVGRGILHKGEGKKFTRLLREVGVENGGDATKRAAIEKYLDTESTYQVYADIGYALSERMELLTQDYSDKSPKSLARKRAARDALLANLTLDDAPENGSDRGSLSARMQEYIHKRYVTPKGAKSIDELLTQDAQFAQRITDVIQQSIKDVPRIPMYEISSEDMFKQELSVLTDSLGYERDIITVTKIENGQIENNLIEDMFFKGGKKYAAARRNGIHSVVIRPDDSGSAFALFTNDKNYGRMMEELSKAKAQDIATYKLIANSDLAQYAAIYELPTVQRYTVGEHVSDAIKNLMGKDFAEIITLKQSENSEKFLITKLNVDAYEKAGGKSKLHAYVNNGVYDYLSSWRMRGGLALDKVERGEFEDATRFLRQQQNEKLKDLSSSSSYRGYWVTDPVTRVSRVVRKPNYTPADYMFGYRMQMIEGLHKIFSYGLTDSAGTQRNNLDILIDAYGEAFGAYRGDKTVKAYRQQIAGTTYFKEFFAKNLFLDTLKDDSIVGDIQEVKDSNIFSLLQEVVDKDTADIFDDSVRDVLRKIAPVAKEGHIYQVLSGTAMAHGNVSIGVAAGEYNVNAFLYSIMRPTYLQQNLGRLFDPNTEWNASDFAGDYLRTVAGSPEITVKELTGLMSSGFPDSYKNQVRHVMTGFKQMNDNDLQLKYEFMEQNATKLSAEAGISESLYKEIRNYMREDMISVNEDKWFIDPRFANQNIVKTPDAKKVKLLDVRRADAQRSGEVLQALVDKAMSADKKAQEQAIITANTIVGYNTVGEAIFAGKNLYARLDASNLDDIFNITTQVNPDGTTSKLYTFKDGANGFTRVIPDTPDIKDTKFMFNGGEKATGHAIDIEAFLEYARKAKLSEITDKNKAIDVLSKMFRQISDGATIIGNMKVEKHNNLMALDSLWRIITTEYVARGEGEYLVNHLNTRIKAGAEGYDRIKPFDFINGRIVSDTSHVTNPALFITSVVDDILNDVTGRTETNNAIRQIIEYTRANNISYGAVEIMNQNEHVSDGIAMDKRIEQGIRQRVYAMQEGKHWDQKWADELVYLSENYNAKRGAGGTQYHNLHKIFNYYNENINIDKITSRNKRYNMEKSLHGIVESLVFYEDPNTFDVASKNILRIDFQKLMNKGVVPQNGMSVSELQSSLFFTDGKPSEALKKLAASQNVDFGPMHSSYSNSIYIDLGSFSIKNKSGKQPLHGFLIPIQNVITDADETMFQTQQGLTASMLSKIQAIIENPGDKTIAEINKELDKEVRDYYRASMKQLAVADKNSDYYKTINRHFMPYSGGMLAGQEVAPLVYNETHNVRLQELLKERREIETRVAYRQYGTEPKRADIARLNEIYSEIGKINKDTAERIREGKLLNFTQLRGTSLEGLTKDVVNGKDVYGYVAATSRKAFEEQGLVFHQLGMDIMTDLEKKGNLLPDKFKDTALKYRSEIMQKINAAGIEGLTIEDEKTMMKELNAWAGQYMDSMDAQRAVSTALKSNPTARNKVIDDLCIESKAINEAIANGGKLHIVGEAFESVAEQYMREVGVVGELIRYPTFRSQFASRFILSDHIKDNSVIMFNPVASSITNVDFDGDLMYSIFNFNGGSGLLAKNATQLQRQMYESTITAVPKLLAQLVEDGEAYEYSDINNITAQMASILKKIDREEYEKVRASYMQKRNITEELFSKAQEFAFATSKEVRDAYLNLEYNTLFDIRSQKASIAPVMRKENIGYISTTNFNARTMIQSMMNYYKKTKDPAYDEAVKILEAVTNPKSAKGGLFDMAEQSGIDTKHVWDAMTTAETARYSTGMHLLFGNNAIPRKGAPLKTQQRAAVEHIVSSLYNSVFKQTHNERHIDRKKNIQSIVNEVMAHKGDWKEYDFGGKDVAAKRGVAALLAIQELDMPNNLVNIRRIFNSSFNRGHDLGFDDKVYTMEAVSDLMEMYKAMHETDAKFNPDFFYSQTYFDGLAKFIKTAFSDRSLQTNENISYVMTSTLKGMRNSELLGEDLFFMFSDSRYSKNKSMATFDVFKYNKDKKKFVQVKADKYADFLPKLSSKNTKMSIVDGSVTFTSRYVGWLNEALFSESGFFSNMTQVDGISAMRNNMNKAHRSLEAVSKSKFVQSLNDVVINPSGTIASSQTVLSNIRYLESMPPKKRELFGQKEYDLIRGLFIQPGADAHTIANRTSGLVKTYEYARTTGQIGSSISANELLSRINSDIAEHPERYKAKPNDKFTKTFDDVLMQRFIDDKIFPSIERIESIYKDMIAVGDFDIGSYSKIVEDLRNSIYDTQKETETLSARYQQFLSSNPYGQTQVAQEAQAILDETIGKFTAEVQALNQKSVDSAQAKIYAMFKDRQQMEAFFGWTGNVSRGAQKVGFGMHIGQNFDSLTLSEAIGIIEEAKPIIDVENKVASADVKYAATETSTRLGDYIRDVGLTNRTSKINFRKETSKVLDDALKEVDKLQKDATIEVSASDTLEEVGETIKGSNASDTAKSATGKGSRKTLTKEVVGKFNDFIKDTGITGKHIGIALAGMAAIGIVNNLLHRQKNGSPLSLARKPNGKGSPSIDGYYPDSPEEAQSAPPTATTGGKTVYHSEGLSFRVSASATRHNNPRQQAAQINSITGGSTNLSIQQDTSKVTDSWLSNKFADLM